MHAPHMCTSALPVAYETHPLSSSLGRCTYDSLSSFNTYSQAHTWACMHAYTLFSRRCLPLTLYPCTIAPLQTLLQLGPTAAN